MPRLNVEAFVAAHLRESLAGVEVRTRVPDPRPERLVVVRRGGGGKVNRLQDRAGLHILIWGGSEWETSELADRVSDLMEALNRSDAAMLAGVSLVEEESLRSDPDALSVPEVPRWFASYTITTHRYE